MNSQLLDLYPDAKQLFQESSCCGANLDDNLSLDSSFLSSMPIEFEISGRPFFETQTDRRMARRKLDTYDIDWRQEYDWQTHYTQADVYNVTIHSLKICQNWSKVNGTLFCENEVVTCADPVTIDVTQANALNFCNYSMTMDQKNQSYGYALATFRRNVRIRAHTYFQNVKKTCYTDQDSSLSGASGNVTLSNALGMYAPNVNDSFNSSTPTTAEVYFYSGVGENTQYLCRNLNCSDYKSIPPFQTDTIVNGTIGGNPTDLVGTADIAPDDQFVEAVVKINGIINKYTKGVHFDWDTTYGAIFEMVEGYCTVSSYAINIKVSPIQHELFKDDQYQ